MEINRQNDPQEMMQLTVAGYDMIADDWHSTRLTFWSELIDKIRPLISAPRSCADIENAKVNLNENTFKLLDVGCGNGRILKELSKDTENNSGIKTENYTGVDVSKNLLELAKKDFPNFNFLLVDTKLEDFNNMFSDSEFDQVLSIAVLHHIPPSVVHDWLMQINRVVKTGSINVFTTWNLTKSYYELVDGDAVIGFMHYKNTRYVHNYTYDEIHRIFPLAGFKVLEISDIARDSGMSNTVVIAEKI